MKQMRIRYLSGFGMWSASAWLPRDLSGQRWRCFSMRSSLLALPGSAETVKPLRHARDRHGVEYARVGGRGGKIGQNEPLEEVAGVLDLIRLTNHRRPEQLEAVALCAGAQDTEQRLEDIYV